ncbi:hypothetical protein STXM2123_2169 [Streptomyces sp. F-3]|nr:hypothetical protein STXM2123_2169 [Streptomyces sp. F-3]
MRERRLRHGTASIRKTRRPADIELTTDFGQSWISLEV